MTPNEDINLIKVYGRIHVKAIINLRLIGGAVDVKIIQVANQPATKKVY